MIWNGDISKTDGPFIAISCFFGVNFIKGSTEA